MENTINQPQGREQAQNVREQDAQGTPDPHTSPASRSCSAAGTRRYSIRRSELVPGELEPRQLGEASTRPDAIRIARDLATRFACAVEITDHAHADSITFRTQPADPARRPRSSRAGEVTVRSLALDEDDAQIVADLAARLTVRMLADAQAQHAKEAHEQMIADGDVIMLDVEPE